MNAVLLHYAGYIRSFSKVNGQVNAEAEDYVKQQPIAALVAWFVGFHVAAVFAGIIQLNF